ncbi:MAG: sulfatase-like hydrolase/transferase [bacterium]|nr:sulfatase-like hydrolase/transferase [bacterium]
MSERLSRRSFMAGSAAALASAAMQSASGSTGDPAPPNVLLIFPDQLRAQALGCMGNPDVKTPHIDRLASEGVLFRQTFANTPVCCPGRACMMTGRYASSHGLIANDLRLRESETTMAELFAGHGYATGFIGKWHLDGGPREPGFVPPGPRRQGFQFWAAHECSHAHFKNHYFRDDDTPIPIEGFEPKTWTDLAIEFIETNRQRPFFLTLTMGPPHDPYGAPKEYEALYDPAPLTLRPNWREGVNGGSRQNLAKYYAAITAIDDQIGRLMDRLKLLGLDENTIILFTSDHGDMLGSHGMRLKRKPFEESIRIPGIMRHPASIDSNRATDALFSHVDFAPTLLSMCGLQPPASMQGSDLSSAVRNDSAISPDSVFFQIFGPYDPGQVENGWRGVRTDQYMYARFEDRPWLLFDLDADPYEMNNLVENAQHKQIVDDMDRRLQDWMKRTGDSWTNDWKVRVEQGGALYKHKTFYTVDEYIQWAKENPDLAPVKP